MFDKKPRVVKIDGKEIHLNPKPSKFSLFKKNKNPKGVQPIIVTNLNNTKPIQITQPPMHKPKGFGLFGRKKIEDVKPVHADNQPTHIGDTKFKPVQPPMHKPKGFGLFGKKKIEDVKPVHADNREVEQTQPIHPYIQPVIQKVQEKPHVSIGPKNREGFFRGYVKKIEVKHRNLEEALREQNMKGTLRNFIKRMILSSVIVSIIIAIIIIILFIKIGENVGISFLIGGGIGYVIYKMSLNAFLDYPLRKGKSEVKGVERDILFAARDMVISLRSGMPLFNAIASVSTGYGEASKEFKKIVERAQLGTPLEEALDVALSESKSPSFRRFMIQASSSLRAGSDVVSALQTILEDLSQERIIELRRYGQKLNAIAMFYMLFGVILPSMGLAVATILTTFISIIQITPQILYGALIGIFFLQIIFLKMITASRPVFSM